ncbi:formyltransferase family protein [Alphaproteobacteria bacterium]|nr:formyltransferase family protein [Alphaproteobacteria bacterium]
MSILILSEKQWGYRVYKRLKKNYPNLNYSFCDNSKNLQKKIDDINPSKVFVLHWGKLISKDLLDQTTFIGFHSSDLPSFRGGSPLQNQIIRGYEKTVITCFFLNKKIDDGKYIIKKKLNLKGSLNDIFKDIEIITFNIISNLASKKKISNKKLNKNKIRGSIYSRLTKSDLNLNKYEDIEKIYNVIRMVDHPEYDNAYVQLKKNIILNLSKAKLLNNVLTCKVRIEKVK